MSLDTKLTEALRKHPFLAFFDEKSMLELMDSAEILSLRKEETIFSEGDDADAIYLILRGSVRLTKRDPDGKEQFLAFVSENDFFGEFGVLDGKPRSAAAFSTGGETTLARLPRDRVLHLFDTSDGRSSLKLALHIIGKVRSINERYVEEQLRKERMTLLGEMADRIIHDMKSPFCVIQLIADMLRRDLPDELTEQCEMLESQLDRVQNMVEEILEFSRGKTQLKKTPVRIAEILGKFQAYNYEYLKQSGVNLQVDSIPKTIEVDKEKMLRVIQNLVNNAVEALQDQHGIISIHAEDHGDTVAIIIEDNGPGIPEELQATLFEPFSTKGKNKGTGLGTAIAKSIVEAHGGQLSFKTTAGKGTTFYIELPTH